VEAEALGHASGQQSALSRKRWAQTLHNPQYVSSTDLIREGYGKYNGALAPGWLERWVHYFTRSGNRQPLELNPVGLNLCKVVMSLLRDPALRTAAKHLGKPDRHLGRDAAFAVDKFGESGALDAQGLCRLCDGEAERLNSF
jgi:hypothetical protein